MLSLVHGLSNENLYTTHRIIHCELLVREAIRTTKIAQVIVIALGCQQELENKTLLLKTLHTLVRDIDKSISNSSGNSLPAGWLSWCQKVLCRLQRKKRLQGSYPVLDPTAKILSTSRIYQMRCTHWCVGGMTGMGQSTVFWLNLRPVSQQGFHAQFCKPIQKPMAGEVKCLGKPTIAVFLNGHAKLHSEYSRLHNRSTILSIFIRKALGSR